MALFSRAGPSPDLRGPDYALGDALLVTADSLVVQLDLTVRFEPQSRDDHQVGWDRVGRGPCTRSCRRSCD